MNTEKKVTTKGDKLKKLVCAQIEKETIKIKYNNTFISTGTS